MSTAPRPHTSVTPSGDVDDLAAERIVDPAGGVHRHHVGVAHQAQRRCVGIAALDPPDDRHPTRRRLEPLDQHARALRCRSAARRRCAPPRPIPATRRSRIRCGSASAAARPCRPTVPRVGIRPADVGAASSPAHLPDLFSAGGVRGGGRAAMRLALTAGWPGRLTTRGCANVATRSSSSCHLTSSSAGGGLAGAERVDDAGVALLQREHLGHALTVADLAAGEVFESVGDGLRRSARCRRADRCRRRGRSPAARADRGGGWHRRPTCAARRRGAARAVRAASAAARTTATARISAPPVMPGTAAFTAARSSSNSARVHGSDPCRRITSSTAAAMQSSTSAAVEMSPANAEFDASASRSALLSSRSIDARVGAAVSSRSRRTPPCITRRWSSGVVTTRNDTLSPTSSSAGYARTPSPSSVGLHDLRQVAEVPVDDPAPLLDRGGAGDRRTDRAGELGLDGGEVGADGMDLAGLVGHDDVQAEVIGHDRGVEVTRPDRRAGHGRQDRRQHVHQPVARSSATLVQPGEGRRHRVVERDQRTTDLLRQRADQRRRDLLVVSRHVPVEAVVGDLVERGQRNVDGHAVQRFARRVAIRQRQFDVAAPGRLLPHVRETVEMQRVGDERVGQIEPGRRRYDGRPSTNGRNAAST